MAFDRRGRLGWKGPRIVDEDPGYGGAHIIEVLCQDAPEAYLVYLQNIGVSYIFAGQREMDLSLALTKLKRLFGIEKLLLEGGSLINGAFQQAGFIDELSLVVAPVIGGAEDKPLFAESQRQAYLWQTMKQWENGVLWLNYKRP